MGTHYSFGLQVAKPGMYELTGINSVGNYAITVGWKDGHHTGIYPWGVLRDIAEKHKLSDAELAELRRRAEEEGRA